MDPDLIGVVGLRSKKRWPGEGLTLLSIVLDYAVRYLMGGHSLCLCSQWSPT